MALVLVELPAQQCEELVKIIRLGLKMRMVPGDTLEEFERARIQPLTWQDCQGKFDAYEKLFGTTCSGTFPPHHDDGVRFDHTQYARVERTETIEEDAPAEEQPRQRIAQPRPRIGCHKV